MDDCGRCGAGGGEILLLGADEEGKKRLAGQSASLSGGGDCESSLENRESVRTRRTPPLSGDAFKPFHTDDTFGGVTAYQIAPLSLFLVPVHGRGAGSSVPSAPL
jgi:hypothetical protein